jgi:release factor glutamine methyltransferase
VEVALAARPHARRVVDLGTGSGCLLLAVLHGLPAASGIGIDRDEAALAVARDNAAHLGLGDRAQFHAGDWAGGLPADRFDLLLANPPYVETGAELARSVRDFEPHGALFAGPDGLDDYRVLVPQVPALLAPGGLALFEIGMTQAEAVIAIGRDADLAGAVHHDLAGRPRVIAFSHCAGLRGQT